MKTLTLTDEQLALINELLNAAACGMDADVAELALDTLDSMYEQGALPEGDL